MWQLVLEASRDDRPGKASRRWSTRGPNALEQRGNRVAGSAGSPAAPSSVLRPRRSLCNVVRRSRLTGVLGYCVITRHRHTAGRQARARREVAQYARWSLTFVIIDGTGDSLVAE